MVLASLSQPGWDENQYLQVWCHTVILDWEGLVCPLWVGGEVLLQVEEYKYLLFISLSCSWHMREWQAYLCSLFNYEPWSRTSLALRSVSWGGLGACLGCSMETSLGRCPRHDSSGSGLKEDTGQAEETMSLGCSGITPESSQKNGRWCLQNIQNAITCI